MEHHTPGRCTPQPWESGRGGKGYCTQLWAPPSFKHTVEESCQSFFLSSHAWRKQAPSRKVSLCQTKVPLSHAEKKGESPCPPQAPVLPRHLVLLPLLLFAKYCHTSNLNRGEEEKGAHFTL